MLPTTTLGRAPVDASNPAALLWYFTHERGRRSHFMRVHRAAIAAAAQQVREARAERQAARR